MSNVKPMCSDHREGESDGKHIFCKRQDREHFEKMFHYCFYVDTEKGCIPNINPDAKARHEQKFHHVKQECGNHLSDRGCNKTNLNNPEHVAHMKYYLHPKYEGYVEKEYKEDEMDDREKCTYHMNGVCRKLTDGDDAHKKRFAHPCKNYLRGKCSKEDDEHLNMYEHPVLERSEEKNVCKFHLFKTGCNKKDDAEHMAKFDHPDGEKNEHVVRVQEVCRYHTNKASGCVNKDPKHLKRFAHPNLAQMYHKKKVDTFNDEPVRSRIIDHEDDVTTMKA
jgi:hypothetical protein